MSAEVWRVLREELDPKVNGYVVEANTGGIPVVVVNDQAEPGVAKRIKKEAKRSLILWWLPYAQLLIDAARRVWESNPVTSVAAAAVITAAAAGGAAELATKGPGPQAPTVQQIAGPDRPSLQLVSRSGRATGPPPSRILFPADEALERKPSPAPRPSESPSPSPSTAATATPTPSPNSAEILAVDPVDVPVALPTWSPMTDLERSVPRHRHHGRHHRH